MHVAQFVHRYPPALGGAEAWAARLSRGLVDAGHQVTVWTTTAIDLPAFTQRGFAETSPGTTVEDGVTVHRYRPSFRWPGRRPLLAAASLAPVRTWRMLTAPWAPVSRRMWRDAGRGVVQVDVVHAIAFPYAAILRSGLRLARRHDVPFVLTPFLHLGDPDDPADRIRRAYTSPPLRWLLLQADRILVQTPIEAQAVRDLGVPATKIVMQGLGVDVPECTGGNRERSRAAWRVKSGEVVIGHLANLSAEKGTMDLLHTAVAIRPEHSDFRVVLAGPVMPPFKRFWDRFGPANWITQLGPLTEGQKRDFFAGIDGFALPSRSDSFGLVFLEAWANAIPVIGYRAGGVADVIRDNRDGRLVRCGDLPGLGRAMGEMIVDEEARRAWGAAGRERLETEFRWADKVARARDALTVWQKQAPATDRRLAEP